MNADTAWVVVASGKGKVRHMRCEGAEEPQSECRTAGGAWRPADDEDLAALPPCPICLRDREEMRRRAREREETTSRHREDLAAALLEASERCRNWTLPTFEPSWRFNQRPSFVDDEQKEAFRSGGLKVMEGLAEAAEALGVRRPVLEVVEGEARIRPDVRPQGGRGARNGLRLVTS